MANKVVNLTISLKDGVSKGLKGIQSTLKTTGVAFKTMAKVAGVAFAGLALAVSAVGVAVKKSFEFERSKVQLKNLLGSMEAATKRFDELKRFAAETPFQLPEIIQASKQLTVFTEGALGTANSLKNIGDAAEATGNGIESVSFWVGRAYSMLKGGKPFGEAAMRLQEMGILTPKVRQEMEDLQSSGASFEEVWAKLNGRLDEFNGAMKEGSKTGEGLVSTLRDNWGMALAEFGDEFAGSAKVGIEGLTDAIKKMVSSGGIKSYASDLAEVFNRLVFNIGALIEGLRVYRDTVKNLKENFSLKDLIMPGKALGEAFKDAQGDAGDRREEKADEDFLKAYDEKMEKRAEELKAKREEAEQETTATAQTESKKRVEIAKEEVKEIAEAVEEKPSGDTVKYNITDKIKAFYEERRKSGSMDLTGGSSIAPGDLQREGLTGEGTSFADFMAGGAKGGDVTTGNYKFPFDAVTSLEGGDATSGVLDTVSGMAGDASGVAQENPMEKIEKILNDIYKMQDKRLGGVK